MTRRLALFRTVLVLSLLFTLSGARLASAAFGDITLVGQTTLSGSTQICDVWGWVDPVTQREYAIVGNWNSPNRVWIVDVSDPTVPTEVAFIDGASGFDVKVWDHYVYTCDWNSTGNDSRIIDIANPLSPQLLNHTFRSAHNIAISQSGYLFLQVSGFSLWDLNTNPEVPDSMWHSGTFNGHDATPKGDNLVWDFGGWDGFARLWDYSTPSSPQMLVEITNTAIQYWHSGDQSSDGDYLYICDELAVSPQPDVWVYDLNRPFDTPPVPIAVSNVIDTDAIVHNLYVIENLAFVSYYNSGFKTLDLTNPASPVVADSYDTNIQTGETGPNKYNGAFGVYPFLPSGIVLVSDWDNGLFLFSVEGLDGAPTAVGDTPLLAAAATLHQNYPNPFNPSTTITYELTSPGPARLTVFDVGGRAIRTLVSRFELPGMQQVSWNGMDDAGNPVSSGVYYYRLEAGPSTSTKKMVLLK